MKFLFIQLRQHVFNIKICVCEALRLNLKARIYLLTFAGFLVLTATLSQALQEILKVSRSYLLPLKFLMMRQDYYGK